MDTPLTFTTRLALETGKHLSEFFSPKGTYSSLKQDSSVVTEADLSADQLITQAIQRAYPADSLISEESQPSIGNTQTAVWVVDPLDGTTNFSLGMPIWGVSIARFEQGWPVIGVIYFPILDELFTAERGSGACLNGERIHTKPPTPGNPTSFFACCTRSHWKYDISIRYKTRILGSACYTFCSVARGMAVLGFEATPKIWDIAASWLIVTESGGAIETFDNSQPFPLQADYDYRQTSFPTLSGANPELVSIARGQIKPKTSKS
jgi:myo-inositol-1(or 4)-monophosphatase